jgi:hypothetical protein
MTAREMLDKRLTIQKGFFKGARITITEAIAKELMEDYVADRREEIIGDYLEWFYTQQIDRPHSRYTISEYLKSREK